ncbi:MAG: hypothetical protein HDR36_03120 [Treponema sp.]|nr:hypothetical protein [Treponema sp.]
MLHFKPESAPFQRKNANSHTHLFIAVNDCENGKVLTLHHFGTIWPTPPSPSKHRLTTGLAPRAHGISPQQKLKMQFPCAIDNDAFSFLSRENLKSKSCNFDDFTIPPEKIQPDSQRTTHLAKIGLESITKFENWVNSKFKKILKFLDFFRTDFARIEAHCKGQMQLWKNPKPFAQSISKY